MLDQNYPNPFNPSTKIDYKLSNNGLVILQVFNILGEEVTELVNEFKNEGSYSVQFNAFNIPSGLYYYRLKVQSQDTKNSFVDTKKMVLLK